MNYENITDVPEAVIDFYAEYDGEVKQITRPATKTITDLERVINLGKPQGVLDKVAELVAEGEHWLFFDDFCEWQNAHTAWETKRDNFEPVELEDESFSEFEEVEPLAPTEVRRTSVEVFAPYAREAFKEARAAAVSAITVEVDGMIFDGDEVSQSRMARAAFAMIETDQINWVLANNEVVSINRDTLRRALLAAGDAQVALWI